jgi:hypothetical protein
MSIVVGTRGGLGTLMPLSGLEAVCQGTVVGEHAENDFACPQRTKYRIVAGSG